MKRNNTLKVGLLQASEVLGIPKRAIQHMAERGDLKLIGNGELKVYRKQLEDLQRIIEKSQRRYNREQAVFTYIDLFAGIGGFRIALSDLGGKCMFSCEWDKFSRETYQVNFGQDKFEGDINKVSMTDIPKHNILCAGFPCQPFSIAGVSKKKAIGQEHGFRCKTQGTLFFNIAEIIDKKRPDAFILENVKNLKSHDKGETYRVIISTLRDEIGYHVYSDNNILDAAHYVPQHRERVFIVGFKKEKHLKRYKFPIAPKNKKKFRSIVLNKVPSKYTLTEHLWTYLQDYAAKHRSKGNGFGYGLVDMDGVSRTLSARYYKDGAEVLINQKPRPRRLTPRECCRLMGFPKDFIITVSDTQAYRQFGNAVVVPVAKAVAKSVIETLRFE